MSIFGATSHDKSRSQGNAHSSAAEAVKGDLLRVLTLNWVWKVNSSHAEDKASFVSSIKISRSLCTLRRKEERGLLTSITMRADRCREL